jgi:hypothetical protein
MKQIYRNSWSSATVFVNGIITRVREETPGIDLRYIDWESANTSELPDADLIGPTALTIEDFGQDQIQVTFAVGVSTYTNDTNMFRHRMIVGEVFEAMRPESKIDFYDADLAIQQSKLVVTAGTLVAPMSRMNVRPWQYVQAATLLVPTGA